MSRGLAAKTLFAACLSVSVADLLLADFVLGPVALASPTPSASASASAPMAPASMDTAVPVTRATAATASVTAAPAPAPPIAPTSPQRRSHVVARFDSDQPSANDDDLRELAKEMIADPTAEILLEGHTDQRGDPERNRALSLDRATWAKGRLVEFGANPSRIAVVGLGAERLLENGDSDAAVASNRRVEVRWLSGSSSPANGDR